MDQDLHFPEAMLLGRVFQGWEVLIQPQTTKQMSGGSLGLFVWLLFLRLALPGLPGSCWCSEAQCGTVGRTGEGESWQEPALPPNPQKALLCVSFHVAPASFTSTPEGSQNSVLSIHFRKCCPWCSNCLRAQSTQFKTIRRYKTELVMTGSVLKSATKCQFEEPWLTLGSRSPVGALSTGRAAAIL